MVARTRLAPGRQRAAEVGEVLGLDHLVARGQALAGFADERGIARQEQDREGRACVLQRLGRPGFEGQADPEAAAPAGFAFYAHAPAQELGQLAHDSQAQARSPEASAGRAVGLGEALEDRLLGIGRNAHAGVGNDEAQPGLLLLRALEAHLERHMALVGEFDGVGRQVDQDLAQMLAAAAQAAGCGGVDMHDEAQALALCLGAQDRGEVGQLRMKVEIDDVDRHLPGLDLGEIEDLVDQRQERPAGTRHGAGHVALVAVELGLLQQVAHADDGVERRTQLMAHHRQEPALRLVGVLGPGRGLGQFADEGGDIARQRDEAEDEAGGEVGLVAPIARRQNDGDEASEAGEGRIGQVPVAVAKAIAEGDPEIEGIERRPSLLAEVHEGRERRHVGDHGGDPARRRNGRPGDDHADIDDRKDEISRGPERAPAEAGFAEAVGEIQGEIVRRQDEHDDDANDRLFVLAVGPALQAPAEQDPEPSLGACIHGLGSDRFRHWRPASCSARPADPR